MPQFKALSIFAETHIQNDKGGLVEVGDVFETDEVTGNQLVRNGLVSPMGPCDAKPLVEGYITTSGAADVDPHVLYEVKPITPTALIMAGKAKTAPVPVSATPVPAEPKKV